ncbi:hypothetical protein DV735_g1363, partial [Chaetothyriales sp. CBS 134920]
MVTTTIFTTWYNAPSIPIAPLTRDQIRDQFRWNKPSDSARQRSLKPILNSTLGFEKVLAINMPERTDHRDMLVLSAAVSDIHIDFVDGVKGDTVLKDVLPPLLNQEFGAKTIGSWRAHINAISAIVEEGWSSALILEDDLHWDVRLKQQLQDFALASDVFLRTDNTKAAKINLKDADTSHVPKTSPYGDDWDVLWVGHCGMDLPTDAPIVLMDNDTTTVTIRNQVSWDSHAEPPMRAYPEHTRAISDARTMVCTLGYAVSQKAARSILYEIGLKRLDHPFDVLLAKWCDGIHGFEKHKCVGVLPQIMDHYSPSGNVHWSVRANLDKILHGETDYRYEERPEREAEKAEKEEKEKKEKEEKEKKEKEQKEKEEKEKAKEAEEPQE